ncbi:MAG: V-type ATP synthase subunit D [Alphaproteobacteria bacterium]|nr:V-type ATP synthase subunit D [Alphaproteobacteria bacterium]
MAKLQLSKSALAREQRSLKTYQRFLPSLDLKRQQVMAEQAKAEKALANTRAEIEKFRKEAGEKLPMLAIREVDLTDLVKLTKVKLGTENVVGTRLPKLEEIEVEVRPYAYMGRPQWVDRTAEILRDMLELRIRVQVEERRVALLRAAVKTVTQRVNLFDKVLIPQTQGNIKRIRIYLSDMETAAVARSKIAKKKHAAAGAA